MEMAGSESSDHDAPTSSNSNHGGQQKLKSTTGGLLAGNGQNKGNSPRKGTQYYQPRCIYCAEPHLSDKCSKYSTLQARKEKLKVLFQLFKEWPRFEALQS